MKRKVKRMLSAALASAMALGAMAGSTSFASEDRVTVTFQTIDFYAGSCNTGDYAEEILTAIEDYCNVNLEIEWVLSDVLEERTSLTLASPSTMPMVMTWSGSITGNVVSVAKDGAFVDLNDYIWDSEKYPNLSQMNESVAETLTVDGMLIAIPRTRDIGRYGFTYRQDWADALGLDEPETIEDVYEMLYAFTYNDPDGNGVDDTYGMEMTSYTGPFDIIQTWFGVGNGWAEVDGQLVPVHMQEEYMEALDWIKKCYDEGLMPADWAVRSTDTWSNGVKTGESGVYIDVMDGGRRIWDYFVAEETYTPSVVNPDEPASMNLLGAINGKTLATSGYNGYFTISATTCDTPEKVEAVLTLLDRLNDNEMRLLVEYGIEGVNWETDEDGNLVDLDTEDTTLAANYAGLNQMLAYIPRYTLDPAPASNERTDAQQAAYDENEVYAVFNPALSYLANSATYSELGATLDDIISQARTQYICGEIDKDGLQAAWDKWLSQGGQAVIDEVNEQYLANQE
ncbi:MAG: extracellular solute-binding protein [Lachnospiraceae bacterium]|nr:extracellular solute-binding protein [Lachnospiraceae bacterium]